MNNSHSALIVAVAARKKAEISQAFEQLESIWDKYAVYEKVEEQPQE